jgi:hypothetical protein
MDRPADAFFDAADIPGKDIAIMNHLGKQGWISLFAEK